MRILPRLLLISLLAACGGDDDDDGSADGNDDQGADPDAAPNDPDAAPTPDPDAAVACEVGTWEAADFAANAATSLALRAQLDALQALMRGAEQAMQEVDDVADLVALYEAGEPSLADVVGPGFTPVVNDVFADFVALIDEGNQDLVDEEGNWAPGEAGGIYGPALRGINIGGLEVRQLVDKGVFGGAGLYAYALSLTEGEITPATIDALAAAWGGNAELVTTGLTDSANYSFAMGFHAEIAAALTAAKSHAANAGCTAQRDEALVAFFRTWEQSVVARTIFYANAAVADIREAATAKDPDELRASALHVLGEGLGLTAGFLGLAHPKAGPLDGAGRIITDEQVTAIVGALGVDLADLSDSTTGEFVEDADALQKGVTAVEATATKVYELSKEDIASYRTPTQG